LRRFDVALALLLIAVLLVWVLVPHALEGAVMLTLGAEHGVHVGDVIGAVVIGWLAYVLLRQRDGDDAAPARRQRSLQ
jgi:hypothetical protein